MVPSWPVRAIRFRPARAVDETFLFALKLQTMKPYIEATFGWDEGLARAFLWRTMRGASVIEVDGQAAGIFKALCRGSEVYLADFALRPELQGQGLGTSILCGLLGTAATRSQPVDLQVLRCNPAQRLYTRLGFEVHTSTETHLHLHAPSGRQGRSSSAKPSVAASLLRAKSSAYAMRRASWLPSREPFTMEAASPTSRTWWSAHNTEDGASASSSAAPC